jgi:hemoglobin-like flavoprotein
MNIAESLDQVLNSKQIIGETFYETFFANCPEVKPFFEGVNLQRQAVLVTMALIVIEQYYSNPYLATEKYVHYLGTKHHDRKIPKELYGKWCESMLETLAKFHGDDWSEALAKEWEQAILRVRDAMFQGYEEHFTV